MILYILIFFIYPSECLNHIADHFDSVLKRAVLLFFSQIHPNIVGAVKNDRGTFLFT